MTFAQLQSRVKQIIRDYTNRRWGEDIVKTYINQGYREFQELSKCLRKHYNQTITVDTTLYDVPDDMLQLFRCEWDGVELGFAKTAQMDKFKGSEWRENTGTTLTIVVMDAEGFEQLRVYPKLDDQDYIGHMVEGTDGNDYYCTAEHTASSSNKPITGADYSSYWADAGSTGSGETWVSGSSYKKWHYLVMDYAYVPTDMSSDSDTPDIPSRFHEALAEYAIYMLQDEEVHSRKNPLMGNRHYNKFLKDVFRARAQINRGVYANRRDHIYPPQWVR